MDLADSLFCMDKDQFLIHFEIGIACSELFTGRRFLFDRCVSPPQRRCTLSLLFWLFLPLSHFGKPSCQKQSAGSPFNFSAGRFRSHARTIGLTQAASDSVILLHFFRHISPRFSAQFICNVSDMQRKVQNDCNDKKCDRKHQADNDHFQLPSDTPHKAADWPALLDRSLPECC